MEKKNFLKVVFFPEGVGYSINFVMSNLVVKMLLNRDNMVIPMRQEKY